ncbi:hypothetical protein KKF34_00200 [Myxococcota bacterium]|nr:hypothetical protein [Myxococcota bacterium]MBU1379563.1 hypothetical protein [Myxococcota bacterium]MBU1495281.1 hypothetical protein [Myxococcota bacterium]
MNTQIDWFNLISSRTDPLDPVEQLILNALESGTHRIDINTSFINNLFLFSVLDYGDGMTETDIEDYLLTFPGSSKITNHKGVGFAKVFSIPFINIIVSTRKYGRFIEAVIEPDGSYLIKQNQSSHDGTKIVVITEAKTFYYDNKKLLLFLSSKFSDSKIKIFFNNQIINSNYVYNTFLQSSYYWKFLKITLTIVGEEKCGAVFFRDGVFIVKTNSPFPFLEIRVDSNDSEKDNIIETIEEVFQTIKSELLPQFMDLFVFKMASVAENRQFAAIYREYFWYFLIFIKSGYLNNIADLHVLPTIDTENKAVKTSFSGTLHFSRHKKNSFNLNFLTPAMILDLRKSCGITDEINIITEENCNFDLLIMDYRDDFLQVFRRIFRSETGKDCLVVYSQFIGASGKFTCLFETEKSGFLYELKRGVTIKKIHLNYYSETIRELRRISSHLPEFSQKILADFISCYR